MKLKGILAQNSIQSKAFIFLGVSLLCVSIASALSYYLAGALFKIDLLEEGLLHHIKNKNVINSYKVAQGVSATALFILAPLLTAFLVSRRPAAFLKTLNLPAVQSIIAISLLMIAATPAINFMLYLNQQLQLPEILRGVEQWMQTSEEQATLITEAFLNTASLNGLLVNLLVMALIPAIGEELFFRGIIQQGLQKIFSNAHLAIFATAIIFSAFHMQFYGFLPRLVLGLLLGYVFFWSKSIWLPAAAHFVNNGAAVVMAYLANKQGLPFNQDTIGTEAGEWWMVLLSFVIVSAILYYLYNHRIFDKTYDPNNNLLSD